jgi:hypothetical protein
MDETDRAPTEREHSLPGATDDEQVATGANDAPVGGLELSSTQPDGVGPAASGRPNTLNRRMPGPSSRKRKPVKTAPHKGTRSRAKAEALPAAPKAVRTFPASTFEDALTLAEAIWKHAAGERIRRLTLFDAMSKSPESGTTRQLITNSGRYGLTSGSYHSEHIELTPVGRIATNPEAAGVERTRARFELAIDQIPSFKALYANYKDKKLPSPPVMRDFLREQGVPDEQIPEAIETFTVNAKFLGALRVIGGAERIISLEQLLEEAPRRGLPSDEIAPMPTESAAST